MAVKTVNIDLNRVEGDLEFQIDLDGNTIVDARCIGTLYRGFEQILMGRAPRDAAVITPRVCGICGTAHLYSAVLALEQIWNVVVPPNGTRVRNLCLMSETAQSDLRQSFLFFTADFCHAKYQNHPLYEAARAAFEPFRGAVHRGTLEQSRRLIEVVAIMGGQWPHSSYMLPGGVTTPLNAKRIVDCMSVVDKVARWFEHCVIGCDLERWLDLASASEFFDWLDAEPSHAGSAVGLFTRFARSIGLQQVGFGTPHMLSYGAYCDPESWGPGATPTHLLKSGFFDGDCRKVEPFDQNAITEHVRYSWFQPYEGGLHPFEGKTVPDYQSGGDRYTWAKAPRYRDKVVQTGPMAELIIDEEPLIMSLYQAEGGNTWLRQFARLRRTAHLLRSMRQTLKELTGHVAEPSFEQPTKGQEIDGEGYGLVTAARGALGHWVCIRDGVIDRYQLVTPTAWNASPRDSAGRHGHWEESLIGLTVDDPNDPVEIGHVVRSHDPCLVCTVHVLETGNRTRLGI